MLGDFNEILDESKRGSNHISQTGVRDFHDFMQHTHLMEIFLRMDGLRGFAAKKNQSLLFIINPEWIIFLSSLSVLILRRNLFDHCALLVKQNDHNWGPKPF